MSDDKYILDIAKDLGVTEDEVCEIIEKLTDAGINGAMAGRMLRAAILKLSQQKEAKK